MNSPTPNPRAIAYALLSVADFEAALELWEGRFGMQRQSHRRGADPGFSRLLGIGPEDIHEQALLVTPGLLQSGIHLIRFREPGAAVRAGAAPTDLVPKSVDIAVRDIFDRYAELEAAGFRFRSKVGRFETDGIVVHEVHLPGPDDVNLVFLEEVGNPAHVSDRGYGVAPQIIAISPDNLREKAFFETVLALEETSYHRFGGPEVERTIGLPPGACLDVRIFGDAAFPFGRLEIVQYEGVKSTNLYPRAVAPARGLLGVSFIVPQLAQIAARARAFGAPFVEHGEQSTIFGTQRCATVHSPAGLRIDLITSDYAAHAGRETHFADRGA